MLGALQLLILQIELVPLIARIKIECVDYVVTGAGCRLKYLIRLVVVGLQEVLEVKDRQRCRRLFVSMVLGRLEWAIFTIIFVQ